MSPPNLSIGVDLGGTKIEAVSLLNGVEQGRIRVPTPRDDYAGTITALVSLVSAFEHQSGATARVGVGIPGSIEPSTGLVKNANSTWLIGQPLRADLETRLERHVVVANDANCFALSEATDGAGAGAAVVFGVILGTGVGGGLAIEGHVRAGANGVAGEWGHNPLPWPTADELNGPPCYCGRRGCIETFLSGPGMTADHRRVTGQELTPAEIVRSAANGDASADATLRRYEHRAARALAVVINLLDPDIIVLGGGLSNIERLYVNVPRTWNDFVFNCDGAGEGSDAVPPAAARLAVRTALNRARHGDSSGVRGAAWLASRANVY